MKQTVEKSCCVVESIGYDEWSAIVSRFADHNYRHVWEYGEVIAARHKAQSEHVLIRRGGDVIGLADVRVKSVPVIGGGVAYVGGGPLTRHDDSSNVDSISDAVTALAEEYVDSRGLTLRVMCPLGSADWNKAAAGVLKKVGFERARWPKAYRTMAINTNRSLDEIRGSFSKNWRKNLRRGEQRGVSIRLGRDPEMFRPVQDLYQELLDRKGFSVELDADFYARANEQMSENERFTVILAEWQGEVCGMNVVSVLGDTIVGIIGATTYEGAKRYAAYLLEWAAIELAHGRGMARYDMGGIDSEDNPGGYDFKRGTRGDDLIAAGPLERRPTGFRAAVAGNAERAIRAMKKSSNARCNGIVSANGIGKREDS